MDPFRFDAGLRVLICRGCGYAVRPSQVHAHLKGHHENLASDFRTIVARAQSYFSAVPELQVADIPVAVRAAVEDLRLYSDGLRCQLDPCTCHYICRDGHKMRHHCRSVHRWTQFSRRGRPSGTVRSSAQRILARPWRPVHCQRLWPSGPGSRFFEVQRPRAAEPAATAVFDTLDQLRTRAEQATWATITAADLGEVSPWLERTGWAAYLTGWDRTKLLTLIQDPDARDPPRETLIWEAVAAAIQICQVSATQTVGVFVRFEAVRSRGEGGARRPLLPYIHQADLRKSCRPWMQIVLFFVRTSQPDRQDGPPYELTPEQRTKLGALVDLAALATPTAEPPDGGFSALHEACVEFCLSLLRQKVRTNEYESPLVCALAVLGVTERGWKGPDQYPSLLSAMFKTSRYMFVRSAIQRSSAGTQPTLALLQEDVSQYMFRGTFTPFDWMYELRAYGMQIARTTTSEGAVEWDGERLLYKDIQFTMTEFRAFIHGLHHEVRTILERDLLCSRTIYDEIPRVVLAALRDNPRESLSGWCFLRDGRNHFPVDGDAWLYQQVQSHHALRTKFFPDGVRPEAWPRGVQEYFTALQLFRTKLLLLIHLVAGQPARIPEILSVRFRNTPQGQHRNVFLESGLVNVTTRWHKGYTISGDVKVINRFLPREVSEDFVRYLWLVQPFVERLEVFYCQATRLSAFLWPADPGGKQWSPVRVRRSLQQESFLGLGQILTIQSYRHIAIAISRKYLATPYHFFDDGDPLDRTDPDEKADDILDLQSAHCSAVAAGIYARSIHERPGETWTQRQRFRQASILWHELLGFASVRRDELAPTGTKHHLPFRDELQRAHYERWERLRTTNPLLQLQSLLGPQASFRPLQLQVVTAIAQGASPILAVMPTAGGKSLLFLLPASYDRGGTTIVIVPLIALRQDLALRCASYGITYQEWDPRQPPDQAQVILVVPEAATTPAFASFLNRLRTNQKLDRIVFDECHLLLDSANSFRPAYQKLGSLLLYETQLVFLTATLPPARELDLWRQLHLPAAQPVCFRTTTIRPNIGYQVLQTTANATVSLIQRLLVQAAPRRTIIYCRTVARVTELAQVLRCPMYHAGHAEKTGDFQRFLRRECRTIVATSALGLGIDLPDVFLVIHAELPYTLLDYGQESGRAGRNGEPSYAVIVRECLSVPSDLEQPLQDYLASSQCRRSALARYFDGAADRTDCVAPGTPCDRCQLPLPGQKLLLGYPASRPAARVDQDRTRYQVQQHQRAYVAQQVRQGLKQDGLQADEGLQLFQRLQSTCFLCVQGSGQVRPQDACAGHQEQASYDQELSWLRGGIKYQRCSGCYFCGLPQQLCNRWEVVPTGYRLVRSELCQYPDVLLRGVAGILTHCARTISAKEAREAMFARVARQEGDRTKETALRFLGQKVRTPLWETNRAVQEFLEYYRTIVL